MKESNLHAQIFQAIHNKYCLHTIPIDNRGIIFRVKNEGKKNVVQQGIEKSMGLIAGVSDLIFIWHQTVIFIEVKTEKGKQSEKQRYFQDVVSANGFHYLVTRSVQETLAFLEKFL